MSENLVLRRKGETSLATWIKRRISRNQNKISVTQGATGSGKSYADIGIALEIDPEFDVETQVVFSLSELMKLINSEEFKKKKWKQIIFEESQISMSNRTWQSAVNKMLNYLLSTFRHQNIILYFNAPYRDFLDSQSMKLIHMVMTTKRIDRKRNLVLVSPKILQYNPQMKKTYEHSLYCIDGDEDEVEQIGMIGIKKPPKEICGVYEKRKKEFTDKLNQEIMKMSQEMEKVSVEKPIETRKALTDKQERILELYKELKQVQLVAKELGVCNSTISEQLKFIRKKGYSLKD